MIEFVDEKTVNEKLDEIIDKLDHMDFRGKVNFNEPYQVAGSELSVSAKLTRDGENFKLPPPESKKSESVRKLTETDWLNLLNYYKMLLDGFQNAQWHEGSVTEQVASLMIKKTKEFFEKNYPNLIEVKKRPIFDKDDFK